MPKRAQEPPWRRLDRLRYRMALPGIPLGLAGALVGLQLQSYLGTMLGMVCALLSAWTWQDDRSPLHPSAPKQRQRPPEGPSSAGDGVSG